MKEGRRGVKVTAFSPGFVPNTNLSANQGFLAQAFMTYIMPLAPFAVRKEDAGKALADLAVSNEVQSGLYYTKGQVKETSPVSRDEAKQDELWSISCQELEISEGEGGFGMSPS